MPDKPKIIINKTVSVGLKWRRSLLYKKLERKLKNYNYFDLNQELIISKPNLIIIEGFSPFADISFDVKLFRRNVVCVVPIERRKAEVVVRIELFGFAFRQFDVTSLVRRAVRQVRDDQREDQYRYHSTYKRFFYTIWTNFLNVVKII